jgi:hypothetical protein
MVAICNAIDDAHAYCICDALDLYCTVQVCGRRRILVVGGRMNMKQCDSCTELLSSGS